VCPLLVSHGTNR